MANSKIFCNIPWFEININHDGSYDLCGCQNDKIIGTPLGQVYNIRRIPIQEYWNSDRLRQSRLTKLGETPDPMCRMCQVKDSTGYASNRVKENLKSVIFQDRFDRSFQQSPHWQHFKYSQENQGLTQSRVRSLHINLGNTCNFACRMCGPAASTRLQTEFRALGWLRPEETFEHWTDSTQGWNNFVDFLDSNAGDIKVVHIIGGEVEFMPKFVFLLDYFVDRGFADTVNISFTTNGSIDYSRHFDILSRYRRCEIGISIESVEHIGDYIRQGGNIQQILENIQYIKDNCPSNTDLTIRTVPSILSLPSYHSLIDWAWQIGIPVDNSMLVDPQWLQASLLPREIKQEIVFRVSNILNRLPPPEAKINNQKDATRMEVSIRNECESIINLAQLPDPPDAESLREIAARRLDQWDQMKRLNIRDYDVQLYDFLRGYGYHGA